MVNADLIGTAYASPAPYGPMIFVAFQFFWLEKIAKLLNNYAGFSNLWVPGNMRRGDPCDLPYLW